MVLMGAMWMSNAEEFAQPYGRGHEGRHRSISCLSLSNLRELGLQWRSCPLAIA